VQSSQKPHGKSASTSADRRVNPRYAFVATTEITESASAPRLSGRVTEISRQGCFVDIPNVLPAGTMLKLRITCDQGTFESKGKILYVQERIGMGITFVDTPEDQVKILEKWLVDLPPAFTV
jgi:PilZ domain